MGRVRSGDFGVMLVVIATIVTPLIIYFACMAGCVWVAGSAMTSGVKAVSESCNETYPIETVFAGDWFCPKDTDVKQ